MRWGSRIGLALMGMICLLLILKAVPVHSAGQGLILATTTSTQDSGLLDFLLPIFERKTGYLVKTIAVGSGEALAMGSRGEADVLLVHSPEAEKKFMAEGHGLRRRPVMHNDFVIVGPAQDPARIQGTPSSAAAFKAMAQAQSLFVSRADQSGTHKMELNLWKAAGLSPQGKWYIEAGQGMGETLRIADQKGGYTLVDRGTYLAMKKGLGLSVLVEGDGALKNFYSVIELDSARHPKVNAAGGRAFADFLVSPETQRLIGIYGQDEYGQPLFFPNPKEMN
ncbi:MAG: substrate-binding domain-containing protein [Nitrospinae bacterium]|nr:substrate-binding domain-containing protein [Nitrospinota bacterium]